MTILDAELEILEARSTDPELSGERLATIANESILSRVLITGGAGFIGRRLATYLVQRDSSVCVMDDFSSPSSAVPTDAARLVTGDVRDLDAFREAARGATCIMHLACVVGVSRVVEEPDETRSVILEGVRNLATIASEHRPHVVYFSSSEVSDSQRRGPRAVYAQSKSESESFLLNGGSRFPVTIVRPFNVVGPDQSADQGMVLPTLARAARNGDSLVVHGDGSQMRAFLHVDDLLDNLVGLLADEALPAAGVFEIGSQEQVSILQVAERLRELAGGRSEISFEEPEAEREDLVRRIANVEPLTRVIDLSIRRGLDDILRDVLES